MSPSPSVQKLNLSKAISPQQKATSWAKVRIDKSFKSDIIMSEAWATVVQLLKDNHSYKP